MAAFNPSDTQDVAFTIAPVNAAGAPTTGPFNWSASDAAAGSLSVAADTLSARFVTNPGSIDCVVVVTDPRTGAQDTATISRTAPPPPDNNTVSINLSGTLVDK